MMELTRETFMDAVRSDFFTEQLTPDDRMEIFAAAPVGSSDLTEDVLNGLLTDYGVDAEVVFATPELAVFTISMGEVKDAAEGWKFVTPATCKAVLQMLRNRPEATEDDVMTELSFVPQIATALQPIALRFDVNLYPHKVVERKEIHDAEYDLKEKVFFTLQSVFMERFDDPAQGLDYVTDKMDEATKLIATGRYLTYPQLMYKLFA